jgi:hypothetical protein
MLSVSSREKSSARAEIEAFACRDARISMHARYIDIFHFEGYFSSATPLNTDTATKDKAICAFPDDR